MDQQKEMKDAWKTHTKAALSELIAALASIYRDTQIERLEAARGHLEKAIQARRDEEE